MATTLTNATFSNTYKDDYTDSDGYYRILFNSGRTLQARELTQAQTIINNQIKRMASDIYVEGSVISEGSLNPNPLYEFVKLNTSVNALPSSYNDLIGTSFTGQTSGVVAKVIEVVPVEGSDPATLYVQYTNTASSPAATTAPIRFNPGENIDNGSTTLSIQTTNTVANPALGVGYRVSVGAGVYYAKGFFIFTEAQSIILSKYTDDPTAEIGFKITEEIVTTADDVDLFDNQGSTPNQSAPGADRYRIRLTLINKINLAADENFIHVATIDEGSVRSAVVVSDRYNVPNEVTAIRISENSGDYIVSPFSLLFEPDSADIAFLNMKVSPGVAVVEGHRAARKVGTHIRVPKATSTLEINNEVTPVDFGNYVIVNPVGGTSGLPNINVFELMNLYDATGGTGSVIGTTRVRAVTEDGANLKYHLFDIKLNSGQAFRDVKSIGTGSTNYFNPILESSKAVLKEVSKNNLLFNLPNIRPQTITDLNFTVQRRFGSLTADASGNISMPTLTSTEAYTNTGDWLIADVDSDVWTGSTSVTLSGDATNGTISGGPTNGGSGYSGSIEVLAYVNKSAGSIRSKTLTSNSVTRTMDSDGNGFKYLRLDKADIYDVQEVIDANDSSISYANRFTLDNGQRDNFYGLGKMVLNSGNSAPGSNIHIKYRYFNHGTSGDFFAVNSYSGQVNYGNIPDHTLANGQKVQLRNVLDFRSVQDSAEGYTNSSLGARVSQLPQPGNLVSGDVTYYLQQAGKLVIDTQGQLIYVKGEEAFEPRFPTAPDRTLPLYNIRFGANTLNDSDVTVKRIDHKRFTMKDIESLEKRVDAIEELASLSLLEIATSNFEVLDSAGLNRTKSGVVVDNFTTHVLSATNYGDYRASIDPLRMNMRPSFNEDNIRLIYDSDQSINTIRKGDNVYLKHTEKAYIDQSLASKAIQINPFSVIVYEGVATLSPTSDEWKDVVYTAPRIVSGGTLLDTKNAVGWKKWEWNWGGTALEDLVVGSKESKKNVKGNTTTTYVNKVASEETILEVIGDKVVQLIDIPWMRSRKIYFKVDGLRPNSKVFAFFDEKSVANWVRSEPFEFYSDGSTDYGNTKNNATEHPDGPTALQTDAEGSITGSFFIPNNNTIRFSTGIRQFKLLDISINKEEDALCIARANYAAKGTLEKRRETILSTRLLVIQGSKKSVTKKPPSGGGGGFDGYEGGDGNGGGAPDCGSPDDGGGGNGGSCDAGGSSGGGGGGGSTGGGCFAAGTLFRMADYSLKRIEHIVPGDIMLGGGSVYAIMQGDGMREEWYNYNGVHVTGTHPVYHNGTWVRVHETNSPRVEKQPVYYSLMNGKHLMISEDGHTFTDFVEIDSEIGGRSEWMIDMLNDTQKGKVA